MSIFIGIKASPKLQEKILEWRKKFEEKLPVRWISAEDLHLTIVPPWNEKNIDNAKRNLEAAVFEIKSFDIEFTHILYGPNPRKPRLIWLLGPENKNLISIEEKLLDAFGMESRRPLKPHMTAARFRQAEFKKFPIKKLDEPFIWKEKVESVTLFESRKIPVDDIKYKILYQINLLTH